MIHLLSALVIAAGHPTPSQAHAASLAQGRDLFIAIVIASVFVVAAFAINRRRYGTIAPTREQIHAYRAARHASAYNQDAADYDSADVH